MVRSPGNGRRRMLVLAAALAADPKLIAAELDRLESLRGSPEPAQRTVVREVSDPAGTGEGGVVRPAPHRGEGGS